METIIAEHIEITPGTCGGKPRIAGHRIRVHDVAVWHEDLGMSAHEICARYPGLTLADIHAALAYYYDHRDEIRRELDDARREAEDLQAREPSLLAQRIPGWSASR